LFNVFFSFDAERKDKKHSTKWSFGGDKCAIVRDVLSNIICVMAAVYI